MKMTKTAILGLTCTMFCTIANADEAEKKETTVKNPHRVYAGPDIFYMRSHNKGMFYTDKADGLLGGLKAGYDYCKPWSIYGGLNGLYAFGKLDSDYRYRSWMFDGIDEHAKGSAKLRFANAEGRLGYNFGVGSQLLLTPFAGLGGYYFHSDSNWTVSDSWNVNDLQFKSHGTSTWAYYALGMRTDYAFCPSLDLALVLKGMRSFCGRDKIETDLEKRKIHSKDAWGYEIDVPLTWHIGAAKKWDLQLEPYFLKLNTRENLNIFGSRLVMGYNF